MRGGGERRMRLVSIFDTNVYRSLGDSAFEEIRRAERNHSVLGYANYATVTELLAHFGDPSEDDIGPALAAGARLIEHCAHYDGRARIVRFISPPIEQIAYRLFGTKPPPSGDPDVYAELLGRWVVEPNSREHLRDSVREIAARSTQLREAYVDELWTNVVCTLVPEAEAWSDVTADTPQRRALLAGIRTGAGLPYLALQIATEAASLLSPRLVEIDPNKVVPAVRKHYQLLLEYRNLVIEKLIMNGPDMRRRDRANGTFDIIVCGAMDGEAKIGGAPAVLVTDDRDILSAADRSGLRWEVLAPDEYVALLKSDNERFVELVDELLIRQQERATA